MRAERSTLFVPGTRPDMMVKAASSAADAVCLDLEDSVTPADKATARGHVVRALRELDFGGRARLVRMNPVDTPCAYRDLVDVVERAGMHLDAVMLPKAGSARDVWFVDTLLAQLEGHLGLEVPLAIEAQIESAAGFVNVREIAGASPRLRALVFGPGDFAASMRMPSSGIGEFDASDALYPGHRWHGVMLALVAAARTNGLRAIDGPYGQFKDVEGFVRSCQIARAMGFDGKQCIHPSQLATVNDVFSPSAGEVAHARAVVKAVADAAAAGQGAATHDGKMIDAASLRMARTILDRVSPKGSDGGLP
jgi:citrate lyase subunit beta/citryl-CoA lyase